MTMIVDFDVGLLSLWINILTVFEKRVCQFCFISEL